MNTRSPQRPQPQRASNDQSQRRSRHPNQIITGIYLIVVNGQRYVGQSTSILDRADDHVADLQKGTHANYRLQQAWNEYGARSFKLYLIQECDRKDLNRLEAYWISKLGTLNIDRPKPPRVCFDARNRNKFLLNFSDLVKDSPKDKKSSNRSQHSGCAMQLLWIILAALLGANVAVYFGFPWLWGFWVGAIGWIFVMSMSTRR